MSALTEMLRWDFLLRDALVSTVLVGAVCPIVGVYFVLRRLVFLGVAVPQVSAAGIAAAFLFLRLVSESGEGSGVSGYVAALTGSLVSCSCVLLLLSCLDRDSGRSSEAAIGTAFVVASAATVMFLAVDPHGEASMVAMLKGDVLSANSSTLTLMSIVFGAVLSVMWTFRRRLLLVSFDRDLARVFRIRTGLWESVLYLCIGAVISVGVMTTGPLVVFGFLLLPTLAARNWAHRMERFIALSSSIGIVSAFSGFYVSYRYDLPLGPCAVSVAWCIYCAAWAARRFVKRAAPGGRAVVVRVDAEALEGTP